MRNAAANFDDDFGLEAPARPKAPRRAAAARPAPAKRKKKSKTRYGLKLGAVPVARYAAIGMSATIAIGILVNALMMQKGRHPAPLFGTSIALGQSATGPKPAPRSKVATVNAAAPAPAAPLDAPRAQSTGAPRVDDAPSTRDAPSTKDDAIGRLLEGAPAAADRPSQKTVIGVQHALAKLGFTVKQTGTFGPQTRKAIEHFEKDHHLTVKGEMSRRLVKLLAAESGIRIEH